MATKKSGKPAKKSAPKKSVKKTVAKSKKSSKKKSDDDDMDDESDDLMEGDKLMIEEEETVEMEDFKPGDEEEFDLDEDLGDFNSYDDDDDDDDF